MASLKYRIIQCMLAILCVWTSSNAISSESGSFVVVARENGSWQLQMEKADTHCWLCGCLPSEVRNSKPRCQTFSTAFNAIIKGLELLERGEEVDALLYLQRAESTNLRFAGLRDLIYQNPRINLHTLLYVDGLSALRKSYGDRVPISEMSVVVRVTGGRIPLAITLPGQELLEDPTDDVAPASQVGKSDASFALKVPLAYLQQNAGNITKLNRKTNPFISETNIVSPSSNGDQRIDYLMGPSFIKISVPVIQRTSSKENSLHISLSNADSVAAIRIIGFPGLHAGCFRIDLEFAPDSAGGSKVEMKLQHPIDQYHETLLAKITETLDARFRQIEESYGRSQPL